MADMRIALQLYTVRDELAKDFLGTLRRVSAMGYRAIEIGGYGGMSAREFHRVLTDLDLTPVCHGAGLEQLENEPGPLFDNCRELGVTNLSIMWLPAFAEMDGWVAEASRLNAVGELCKRNDLQLHYHNHAHEFVRIGETYGLDLLFQLTDARFLKAELDLYWVKKGGGDPVEYVRKMAGRVPLLHMKDVGSGPDGPTVEVGQGILDWDAILAAARVAGTQWLITEQDVCQRPPLESAEMSLRFLAEKLGQ